MIVELDPLYVAARKVLLDALEALASHRDSIIVVGAQAIYLRAGVADIAVAPYTTDADLALDPEELKDEPLIELALQGAGFDLLSQDGGLQPGSWGVAVIVEGRPVTVPVDLLVPEAFAKAVGRRSAGPPPHDRMAARKVSGLEATLVDNDLEEIRAIDPRDRRAYVVKVAGPTGLLVAKVHKIHDRLAGGRRERIDEKDAADAYRLMQATPAELCAARIQELVDHPKAGAATQRGVEYLEELFGAPAREGIVMAAESLRAAVPEERIRGVCGAFMRVIRARTRR